MFFLMYDYDSRKGEVPCIIIIGLSSMQVGKLLDKGSSLVSIGVLEMGLDGVDQCSRLGPCKPLLSPFWLKNGTHCTKI